MSELFNILNFMNDKLKIMLLDLYKPINIKEIEIKLNKSCDEKKIKTIIKAFKVLILICNCVDIKKFIEASYNIKEMNINIDIKKILIKFLKNKVDNIEFIINNHLIDIIDNIELIMKNIKFVMNNLKEYNKIKDIKPIKIIENENLTVKEKDVKIKKFYDTIFNTFRILISSNLELTNKLNVNYSNGLYNFIYRHLPYQYYTYILDTYDYLKVYLGSLDIKKLIKGLQEMKITGIKIDIKELIIKKIDNLEPKIKEFLKSLISKLNNLIICVEFILLNPQIALKNYDLTLIDENDEIF